MSPSQLTDFCRIICLITSALTLVSAIGYFVFGRITDQQRAANISQLELANRSLSAQSAQYETELHSKEQLLSRLEKDRASALEGTKENVRRISELKTAVSDDESLLLLGTTPPQKQATKAFGKRAGVEASVLTDRRRQLTKEQYDELVTALRAEPRSRVEFLFDDSDEEAAFLANQLSSAISAAGFNEVVMPPPGKRYDWTPPVVGVRVAIAEGRPVP